MQYSKNLKLNLPERNDQYNLDHWNENTNNLDELVYQNQLNISQNQNDISKIFNGLDTKNVNDSNSVYYKLMKLIYPIGCLYWSSNNTNPSQLFGGTWAQIKDKFILACGNTYTNGATGGSSTVTLTVNQIPSHTHTGPSHTHSFTPSGTVSVTTNPTFSGTQVTSGEMSQNASGYTGVGDRNKNGENRATGPFSYKYYRDGNNQQYAPSDDADGYCLYMNISHTHTVTAKGTISGGTYKFTGTAGTTGGSTANTADTIPTFTGTAGTTGASGTRNTGSTGGEQAHNNMPPYIVKYCWERTK